MANHQDDKIDKKKRSFLIAATTVTGAIGAGAIAVPFLSSMTPSERAKAAGAPVEVDISKIETGSMITTEWRGQPVWIINRSKAMLDDLKKMISIFPILILTLFLNSQITVKMPQDH